MISKVVWALNIFNAISMYRISCMRIGKLFSVFTVDTKTGYWAVIVRYDWRSLLYIMTSIIVSYVGIIFAYVPLVFYEGCVVGG